jgi:hypothetical protein
LDQLKNLFVLRDSIEKKSPQTSSSIENHQLKIARHFWQYLISWNFSDPIQIPLFLSFFEPGWLSSVSSFI